MQWPRTTVNTEDGPREAVGPVIISASRATDIPAFHHEWFMRRLDAGYVKWRNPFNGRAQYVSLERTRAVVFWSKNPRPLLKHLDALDRRGLTYYFQFTLNDYDAERYEPHVPPLEERIETFRELSRRLGRKRMVCRFDPLLLTSDTGEDALLAKVAKVGEAIHPLTERLVFSFANIASYRKVQRNLRAAGVPRREFAAPAMHKVAAGIAKLNERWGLELLSCAETVDLSPHGVDHGKCIDDALLARIGGHDAQLMGFLERGRARKQFKDKGQREACGCIPSKDIGQYNTCPHLCVYCYANSAPATVRRNAAIADAESDSIITDQPTQMGDVHADSRFT